ncbi:MAG: peptidoglycan peptidase [Bacteroidetes bacterium]|nr:MAG: peptidoglycan peptidase [Bacteroidota bacterium]
MKRFFLYLLVFGFILLGAGVHNDSLKNENWQNGDIVFQDSESAQSLAIKLATNSKFSHCGIVLNLNDEWIVMEAVQPVRIVPVKEWIAQGTNGKYSKKRLKNDKVLTTEVADKMWATGKSFLGKNYDIYFGWGDDKLYCSELVWKIYNRALGIELGSLKKLKDYSLNSKEVREQLKLRYGKDIPLNDKMISPQDIFESDLLE